MKKITGFKRLVYAIKYSFMGLKSAMFYETAIRQELFIFIAALVIMPFLTVSAIERLLLLGSLALIIIVELLNSAIESTVDRIGKEFNELSGRAKDFASAAVFCTILLAAATWITILCI